MITSLEEIRAKYGIQEYALPGWEPGADFVCKLRRPGLTDMTAAVGFVPNPLMGVVADLFTPTGEKLKKIPRDQQSKGIQAIARYALVEPTYDQLAEAGIALTDEQYQAIYAFALGGAAALERFRTLVGREPGDHGANVSDPPVEAGGD